MKNIVAIVPVRGGSQRVKDKNLRKFNGSTLLDIKLETLKKVSGISNIIVSSDDSRLLDIAKKHGVETHEREEYYASGECTNSEFFHNLASVLKGYDNVMYSPVTCPLISIDTYRTAINRFQTCDNLVTAKMVKHHLWFENKPLNYDIKNSPNSQDLPDIMQITYGISLIDRNLMAEYKNIVTHSPEFCVLDEIESMDIDTMLDFRLAEHIHSRLNKKCCGGIKPSCGGKGSCKV